MNELTLEDSIRILAQRRQATRDADLACTVARRQRDEAFEAEREAIKDYDAAMLRLERAVLGGHTVSYCLACNTMGCVCSDQRVEATG